MASFDLQGAMNAGVPLSEIADFLASKKKYNVEAARAAGIHDWDIVQELNKPEPGLFKTFTGGVRRSIGELGVLAGDTLPALAASAVLPEEMAKPFVERQLKEAEESRAELEERYPTQFKSYKDVEDIRSGIGYVFERTGELVPDIVPSLISGGIGYQVGKKAAQTAAEKAVVGVAERAGTRAGERATREALESGAMRDEIMDVADDVSKNAAAQAAKKFLEKSGKVVQEKGIRGAKVGVYFGSYVQNSPEIFESIIEETGEIAPAGALLFGGLSAYLDSFLPNQILGNLGVFGKSQIVAKMLQDSGANPAVWKAVLAEGSKAAVQEGLTESAQEGIKVAAEKTYGSNKEFFDPENVERYLESFFAGAAGGGVLGSVSGVAKGLNEKAAARQKKLEEQQEEPLLGPQEGLDEELAAQAAALAPAAPITETEDVPVGGATTTAQAQTTPPPPPAAGLPEGFDISKVEPVKVQTARQFLTDYQNNNLVEEQGDEVFPLSKLEINRRLQTTVRSLGIPLKGVSRKTENLANLLAAALGVAPTVAPATQTAPTETVTETTTETTAPTETVTETAAPTVTETVTETPTETETGAPAVTETTEETKPTVETVGLTPEEIAADRDEQVKRLVQERYSSDPEALGLVELSNNITSLRDDLRALRKSNEELFKAARKQGEVSRYTTPESALDAIKGGALELDPTTFQREAELSGQINKLEDDFSRRQERLFAKTGDQRFFALPRVVPSTRPELTEEGQVAPTGPTERFVLKEDGTYGPQEADEAAPSFAIDKETKRMVLVDKDGNAKKLSSKQQGEALKAIDELYKPLAENYNKGATRKSKLPGSFRSLPPDMKQVFLRALFVGFSPESAFRQLVEYKQAFVELEKGENESAKFFEDLKQEQKRKQKEFTEQYGDIYDLKYRAPPRKPLSEIQAKERADLAAGEEASRQRAVREAETKRSLEQQPVGKGEDVDPSVMAILTMNAPLEAGAFPTEVTEVNMNAVLKTLADTMAPERKPDGKPIEVDPKDQTLKKLALSLSRLNLRTKIIFGGALPADRLAEYDPKTDIVTIRRGTTLKSSTLLHELVHAATVKVLNAYEKFLSTGDRGDLTTDQIEAAEQLYKIYDQAKKRIKLPQYQSALENVYEFIAYAMTDPRFQTELGKHKAKALAKYTTPEAQTLWGALTGAIMRVIDFIRSPLTRQEAERRAALTEEYLDENLGEMAAQKQKQLEQKLKRPLTEDEISDMIAQIEADVQIDVGINRSAFDPTGNFALEVAEIFQEIMAAPDRPIEMAPLPATALPAPGIQTPSKLEAKLAETLEDKKPGLNQYKQAINKTFTNEGITNLVKKLQNERIWIKRFQDYLAGTGQLVSVEAGPKKLNNIYTQLSLASGRAKDLFQKFFFSDYEKANDLLANMVKLYGIPVERMLARLHVYAIGLHGPERRHIKYLRSVPLVSEEANQERKAIFDKLAETTTLSKAQATDLRNQLEKLVAANKDQNSPFKDESHDKYNTLAHTAQEEALYRQQYDKDMKDPNKKALVDAYFETLEKIKENTVNANRDANYYSAPVDNFVKFYDFKHYFSFKGKPESEISPGDRLIDPYKGLGGEYQDKAHAFEGRLSESDNPMLNTLNEGARAALRLGRKDVTLALKNLSENPNFKNIAEVIKTIPFKDRYEAGKKYLEELKIPTQNTVFHYRPDGAIDIIEIKDKEMREGIRRPFEDTHPIFEIANKVTSFFGQMHTRYNPAFAPIDFTRNLLTYAGIVAAEYGMGAGGRVLAQMSSIIADGGMHKTAKFSLAFARGDTETMDRLSKQDPQFYGELARYFQIGGRVAYVQALSYRDNLLEAVEGAGRNPVLRTKAKVDKFFDAWLDMFEMTTRMAAFRTMKAEFIAQGMDPASAEVEAAAFAKNLANFEQVGEWGRTAGAFFMFFRPAATGAVRAIQSLAPAFDFRSDADVIRSVMQNKKFGGATEEQALQFLASYNKQRKNARTSGLAIMGMGAFVFVAAYMMAGEDEEERNKVLTDDPARWVRNARFNTGIEIGGQDLVIQIPWGFGNGALASAGAQIAFTAFGGQSFLSMTNNIMDATFESFVPLPISKINKFENPAAWAVDSITPSALRPLFEFTMNMDGLGREIYNNRQSRYADAYTGGDNIPLFFKDAAEYMYETFGADASPNSLYFFANSYLDGVSRVTATTWALGNVMIGRKDFDPRTDTFLLDAYLKSPSNYDSRMFAEAEKRIKQMEKDYKSVEGTDAMAQYLEENPLDKGIVDFYNKYVNQDLKDLRAEANMVRRNKEMTPAEKQRELRLIIKQQNQIKSAFTNALAGYDEGFEEFTYD